MTTGSPPPVCVTASPECSPRGRRAPSRTPNTSTPPQIVNLAWSSPTDLAQTVNHQIHSRPCTAATTSCDRYPVVSTASAVCVASLNCFRARLT